MLTGGGVVVVVTHCVVVVVVQAVVVVVVVVVTQAVVVVGWPQPAPLSRCKNFFQLVKVYFVQGKLRPKIH